MNLPKIKKILRNLCKYWDLYLFISPFFILYGIFMLYPILSSFWISLLNWDGLSTPKFIGLLNYKRLFNDPLFWKSLSNTAYIFVVGVPIMIMAALILGVILNDHALRLRKFFRTVIFMPIVSSMVVVSVMFLLILEFKYGIFNYLLAWLGINHIPWLINPTYAKIFIIILMLWRWTGYNMVIVLAGLQGISEELYEVAKIDGAGPVRTFYQITLPLLKPIILFIFVLSTIGTFKIFAEPYILTQGGPSKATYTIVLYLYETGFKFFDLGYASALAYVLIIIIAVLTILQLRFFGKESTNY